MKSKNKSTKKKTKAPINKNQVYIIIILIIVLIVAIIAIIINNTNSQDTTGQGSEANIVADSAGQAYAPECRRSADCSSGGTCQAGQCKYYG